MRHYIFKDTAGISSNQIKIQEFANFNWTNRRLVASMNIYYDAYLRV